MQPPLRPPGYGMAPFISAPPVPYGTMQQQQGTSRPVPFGMFLPFLFFSPYLNDGGTDKRFESSAYKRIFMNTEMSDLLII